MEDTANKLKEENKTQEKPSREKADESKMNGVGNAKTNVQGGRGSRGRARSRAKQDDCNESFITGEIENLGLGYSGYGSLSSCGSTRNVAREHSFAASAVNDLSLAMQGVSINEPKKIKSRGRGKRIQKE